MAIDTAEKRKSISGILMPLVPGVTPNSLQDSEWRAEAGWNYCGIAFGGAAFYTAHYYYEHLLGG